MNNTISLLPQFSRKDYTGRTDKYALQSKEAKLLPAIRNVRPVDVTGSVLNDAYVNDAATRLADYKGYWNFYVGNHFQVAYDGGHKKTPFNFCRSIVDKRADWVAGKGFSFYPTKGNELVSALYKRVWDSNGGTGLIRRTAKMGLAYGDAFWYFTLKTRDINGDALPTNLWSVRVNQINPNFCFPVWSEYDPQTMKAFIMQFPVMQNSTYVLYTAVMTAKQVTFYIGNDQKGTYENRLGVIPVVHIPNNHCGDALFGSSILKDVIPINEAYNEVHNSIRKVIRYHGEPTTLVYGARLSAMERGANKVWSNLPPPTEARVENLEMKGELAASYNELEKLEEQIYILGRTPKIAFDSFGAHVSNTSASALQLLLQPLIEATNSEQNTYSNAILKGNKIIRLIHEKILGEDISLLADDKQTIDEMEVCWKSLLPRDEQVEIDNAQKKIAMGIWSRAEASRQLSGVTDTEKLALELAADAAYDLATVAEKQRALNGQPPNMTVVGLSSMFLSEDLVDIIKKVGDSTGDANKSAGA